MDDDLHGAFLWILQRQLLLPVGGATASLDQYVRSIPLTFSPRSPLLIN